jgi:hypothetical protein
MGQSYGPRRIFLPAITCLDILSKTLCSGPRRRPGRQAHGGTALAPRHHVRCPWDFLGLINSSRTSLVRNNERYLAFSPAVSQAFLEVSDPLCQFFCSPSVPIIFICRISLVGSYKKSIHSLWWVNSEIFFVLYCFIFFASSEFAILIRDWFAAGRCAVLYTWF